MTRAEIITHLKEHGGVLVEILQDRVGMSDESMFFVWSLSYDGLRGETVIDNLRNWSDVLPQGAIV